ncbi:DNA mismatch repair protein MutS [Halteromyces radiatus]|uniref:DNA mismatch repair protein MutS n=1 Tax=Halteromyces radiatus TaxID=101107 RepID=UPI00221ECE31|nr:DNA mismatch repair protein MutS [Halteromyces radiatus]KAI8084890.1 DNA mismatch repair protein MutS [Halteromyces radiatus]
MLLRQYVSYHRQYFIQYSFIRSFITSTFVSKRITSGTTEIVLQPIAKQLQNQPIQLSVKQSNFPIILEPKQKTTGSVVLDTVREYTKKYPLCVLLVQVGDFYELYESHATRFASLLDLKLTRKKVANGQVVDFAGFPSRSLHRYVDILVNRLKRRVALCEQLGTSARDDGSILGMQRAITRIITPGTVIEERYLTAHSSNYLLAVYPPRNLTNADDSTYLGLAWVDISTGEFILQQTTVQAFKDDIVRIQPREVILPEWMEHSSLTTLDTYTNDELSSKLDMNQDTYDPITRILATAPMLSITYQPETVFDAMTCRTTLNSMFGEESNWIEENNKTESNQFSEQSLAAAMALLHYIDQTHVGRKPKLLSPTLFTVQDILRIDSAAMASLELLKGLMGGRRQDGLLGMLDHTMTNSGSRLLSQWLSSPLGSIKAIQNRLDIVDYFYHHGYILSDVRYQLKQSTDAQRALQRLAMRRGQYSDLFEINRTFNTMKSIQQLFQHTNLPASIQTLLNTLDPHDNHINDIQHAFIQQQQQSSFDIDSTTDDETNYDGEMQSEGYGFVNPDYNPTLKRLYNKLKRLEQEKNELQDTLRSICGKTLCLISQSPYGHIVEVNSSQAKKLEAYYQDQNLSMVHQTKGKKRYHLPLWADISMQLEGTVTHIMEIEGQIFEEVVNRLLAQSSSIIRSCHTLAQLDTLTTFAWLAKQHNWTRPEIHAEEDMIIEGGRHPVVETYLGRKGRLFTKNDCALKDDQRLWLLTGPNMGGKSTFLRQNAIIVVMAHMGCFVPAKKARIGLTDYIFSRVGAADNLAQDQSTFMVEMTETATILKNATSKSLVIMDEVGRGTSTSDGFALAYAILDDLNRRIGCRTLFATHYHELAEAVGTFENLKCFKTSLYEDHLGFSFLHRVEPGVCRQSHGLKVAQVAGLPPSVVNVATSVWQSLSAGNSFSVESLEKAIKDNDEPS